MIRYKDWTKNEWKSSQRAKEKTETAPETLEEKRESGYQEKQYREMKGVLRTAQSCQSSCIRVKNYLLKQLQKRQTVMETQNI